MRDISLPKSGIRPPSARRDIRSIGVLLIPEFAIIAYASALEPFRAANRLSGRTLYRWAHLSPDGAPVKASNGVQIVPDLQTSAPERYDLVIVCASGNPTEFRDRATFAWLRKQAKNGASIAGVSGGCLLMARAGLLAGYRCTLHWEYIPAFVEEFPDYRLTSTLYEIDRDRLSCSGGTAGLDMMAEVIAGDHGHELANDVAEWFAHTHLRQGDVSQRMPVRERLSVAHPRLVRVLEHMDDRLEEPASRRVLAKVAGVSIRQVERLFRQHLGRSLSQHYLELRLRRARILLLQSTLSVIAIAVATGFVSASHFSRAYKTRFGHSPSRERRPLLSLRDTKQSSQGK
jgi:transcriptional regulator GlxA family with amidase domain